MLLKLSRSLKALVPYGIFIYILGVVVRYGFGSALGLVPALIGVALVVSRLASSDQQQPESGRS